MSEHGTTRRARTRRSAARREQVALLYERYCREGNPTGVITRIARELGVNHSTISRDLDELDIQWRDSALEAITIVKARLIAELERDIAELREEWTRSRTDQPTETTVEGKPGSDGAVDPEWVQRRKRSAAADVRYQAAITSKQAELARLVGAYAPDKIAQTDPDGTGPQKLIVEYVTIPLPQSHE